MIKSKILRHENQLASQVDKEALREITEQMLGIGITLDHEVEIRQEVRDEAEGFVDWGLLQVASDCIELAQLIIEDEFNLAKGGVAANIKQLKWSAFANLKEDCDDWQYELRDDAVREATRNDSL